MVIFLCDISGALNLETFDAPFVEPITVDEQSPVQLLAKIEARNPDKRIIHVTWDNAPYYRSAEVKAFKPSSSNNQPSRSAKA